MYTYVDYTDVIIDNPKKITGIEEFISGIILELSNKELDLWPINTTIKKVPTNDIILTLEKSKRFENFQVQVDKSSCEDFMNMSKSYALIINGNVHVKGDLILNKKYSKYSTILINGNLTVDGTFSRVSKNSQPSVIVMGNISAHNIIFGHCSIWIDGKVDVEKLLLVITDSEFIVNREITAKYYYGKNNYIEANGIEDPKNLCMVSDDIFLPKLMVGNEIKKKKLIGAILSGKEFLK